jgi:probable HAF family extracellular repeat protein
MKTKKMTLTFLLLAALVVPVAAQSHGGKKPEYQVYSFGAPLGGSASGAAAVNNFGFVAGDSNITGDATEHAFLWALGDGVDMGTLGGPNSAVLWPGLNDFGVAVGISDTSKSDPLGETWSCGAFLPPSHDGYSCLGFVWNNNIMTALDTLGGNNGFATAVNDSGKIVGWTETTYHDPTCVAPQVLQFLAVEWSLDGQVVEKLKPYGADPDSAATGINQKGQAVGISGICQNAVGNLSAKHALLWDNGNVVDLGNLGGKAWNTPMAINNRGRIVGFSDRRGDDDGANPNFHAFLWTKENGMQDLGTLEGDTISEALGINDEGHIVGVSFAAGFTNPHAFLWQNGKMLDLNKLSTNSSLTLQVAQEINDLGVIVGQAVGPGSGTCGASSAGCAFAAVPQW